MADQKEDESRSAISVSLQLSDDSDIVEAYSAAFLRNKTKLAGKVAIEVECGCAWLSMLAVRVADLKLVYALESNQHIAEMAGEIVKKNGMESKGKKQIPFYR